LALSIATKCNPENGDFTEMSFHNESVKRTFQWLGREPRDFLVHEITLDKTYVDEFTALSRSNLDCPSLDCINFSLSTETFRITTEFMLDCYFTWKFRNV